MKCASGALALPALEALAYTRRSAAAAAIGSARLMLTAFRSLAKSPVATVLIGLIAVSFIVVGSQFDVFRGGLGDSVVVAGDRRISPAQFKRLFDNFRDGATRETGRTISYADADSQGLVRRLLEDMQLNEAFAALMSRIGIHPAEPLVNAQLRRTPIFFNEVTGQFDPEKFQSQLADNGLTPEIFLGYLRDDTAQQHFALAVAAGFRVPRIYGAVPAVFEGETRDLSYFIVDPSVSGVPGAPTDAELKAFMRENAEALRRPETRTLSMVRFSAAELAPTIQVDDAELQRQFEFRKESLSQPERRTFIQITAPDRAAADRVAQQLRAGQSPDAVARSLGREPVRYDAQPRSAVSDAAAANAAFSLQPGAVSDPFQGGLGFSVIKLDAVLPARIATLEEARPALEQQIRTDRAADRVLELVQKYEDAVEGGATLAEAAKQVGRPVVSLPPVTEQGTDALRNPTGIPPVLLEEAFKLPVGGESDIIDVGRNEYFALRVDRRTPASMPPLEEVRGPLTQAWVLRRTVDRARARADALAGELRGAKAKSLQAVAASVNAPVNAAVSVQRGSGGQTLSPDLVAKAFEAKKGEIVIGEHTQLGFVVARVDAAAPPTPAEAARSAEDVRPALGLDVLEGVGEASRLYARDRMKAKADLARARLALGLAEGGAPADAPK